MTVGVIGFGMVGKAISRAFKELDHKVLIYDKYAKFSKLINLVDSCRIIFVCVPTPIGPEGECDLNAVKDVLNQLKSNEYKGVVAVKSTIEPGTTEKLFKKYPRLRICHVPEFLREKYGYEDFTLHHNNLVIGTEDKEIAGLVQQVHGHYPKNVTIVTPTEAELIKYFSNTFKAYKTVFACTFGTICDKLGADYSKVLEGYINEGVQEKSYLKYNEVFKGFGGACLPKDVNAMKYFVDQADFDLQLFKFLIEENKKFV